MKTIKSNYCLLFLCILLNSAFLSANDKGILTISGVIKDQETKKVIDNVSITVPGTGIGIVSNADGYFSLKIKNSENTKQIEFAHIGYSNKIFNVYKNVLDTVIYLSPNVTVLSQITVMSGDASKLVEEALLRVGDNYSNTANLLTGFYRETIQKRKQYISVSEAILNVYKLPYNQNGAVERERVQIDKGRRLISLRARDTLSVKLQGGPTQPIYLDVVKNPDFLLNQQTLHYYNFSVSGNIMINEREHYIINFIPKVSVDYPLHYGVLYIDKESLTFTRAEFNMNMDDKDKATNAILKKKPRGLRFTPDEVSFLVSYRKHDDRSYINYIRNDVKFRCDWKRKLFRTNYSVVSEMVVIDGSNINERDVISKKQAFNQNFSFSDKVGDFLDAEYWKDFNIIEPTESLESAVNKLRKQYN